MGHSMVRQTLNRCNAQQVPFRPPRFYNLEDNIFQSEMAYEYAIIPMCCFFVQFLNICLYICVCSTTINGPPGSQPMQGLNAILSGYLSDTAWKVSCSYFFVIYLLKHLNLKRHHIICLINNSSDRLAISFRIICSSWAHPTRTANKLSTYSP